MDRLYIISYDISNQRRWKKVFKLMHGFGEWLQLSVFQCRLGKMRALQLEAALVELINANEDHVLILDLGPASDVQPKVRSLGKAFKPLAKEPVIV
ncbi:MAG: CRISPR-associated endonuclease Cas2 [Deltaproteobacteria bacterium]|nr:CRISPR-associated endonuclease Cas2 [Deltaproteobacteria bacterium]